MPLIFPLYAMHYKYHLKHVHISNMMYAYREQYSYHGIQQIYGGYKGEVGARKNVRHIRGI